MIRGSRQSIVFHDDVLDSVSKNKNVKHEEQELLFILMLETLIGQQCRCVLPV